MAPAPAPDSPRSSQSPAPPGSQGDLELELLGLANALYNLGTTVINDSTKERDKPGGGKQVGLRVNEVVTHLSTIDDMAQNTKTMIPLQILTEVDNSRNPMLLTRERIERAATENQFMNGKIAAIDSYRKYLNEALVQNFPELEEYFRAQPEDMLPAPPFAIDDSSRTELIKSLLRDLKTALNKNSSKNLSYKDAAQALLAVKELGKNPVGSEFIATPDNLITLLELASSLKDDPEASSEALRSIANALFLIEKARSTILEERVDGGVLTISMLEKTTLPDHIFVLSRILFLVTVSGPPFIRKLVEDKYNGHTAIEIIGSKLDLLTVGILAGRKMAREAMTDILKFTFNILLYYPKMVQTDPQTPEAANSDQTHIIGDFWSSKLDNLLAPALRVFTSLPPTSPSPIAAPLTHVIHTLITIPVSAELRPIWFGTNAIASPRMSASNSPRHSSRSQTPQPAAASSSNNGNDPPQLTPVSPKSSTLDRALSVLSAGRRSLSRSPPSSTTASMNVVQRTYELIDTAFAHFFPDIVDVDDASVRDRAKQELLDNSLDDLLSPLVVLLSRICAADEVSRVRVRQLIIPDDLDRSSPLEGRSDLLGRCLRLMTSVYHSRLKDSVGEMLFAICDSDASVLSALVGYGNVAGFLYNKGVLSAPPAPSATTSTYTPSPAAASINPITGTTNNQRQDLPEMTDEEKEREAEKLFVLFDRLEKTGAIPPSQNPIRKAIQEGKIG
ncbi:hypothetical protein C0993_001095 [Termitomyces sp. T159_Od127]|nr:hypothetical protein C0993_001095 [Termitomyces sp. T159_Od127]